MSNILSLYRTDPNNIGDRFCAPYRYLPLGPHFLDILRAEQLPERSNIHTVDAFVVGGGGMTFYSLENYWKVLVECKRRYGTKIIAWGIGTNSHNGTKIDVDKLEYPSYFQEIDLVGIRDYNTKHEWVPCSSCLHPLFQSKHTIKHEVVVFEHRHYPTNITCFPKLVNNCQTVEEAIEFIGSAETVITSSYHGAYWAQLLGKKVIAIPFSNKFYYFKHNVTICTDKTDWKKCLLKTQNQDCDVLQDCISANHQFYDKVKELLK